MKIEARLQEISKKSWKTISQEMELSIWKKNTANEDKNKWWEEKFNNYISIENEPINSIMEVGCGPFAVNIQNVIRALKNKPAKIILNDPLLQQYLDLDKPVKNFIFSSNAIIYSIPLEECIILEPVDLIICINVLDHVYSLHKCLQSIEINLKPSGILILGNDLTNEENFRKTPTDDPNAMLHPIRFDYPEIKEFLDKFEKIYEKISEPSGYHCGSLFFIGRKQI
jgi:SAM-dependent methyltransferase